MEQTPAETAHLEEAFASSMVSSLLVALVVALAIALTMTWFFTHRVMLRRRRRRVDRTRTAHGDYRVRISPPGLGTEFDQLGTSINQLAERWRGSSGPGAGCWRTWPRDQDSADNHRGPPDGTAASESVMADRERMGQAPGNLLDHAIRHGWLEATSWSPPVEWDRRWGRGQRRRLRGGHRRGPSRPRLRPFLPRRHRVAQGSRAATGSDSPSPARWWTRTAATASPPARGPVRDVHHPPPQVAPLQKLHGKPGPIIIGAQRLVIPLVVTLIAATGGGIWADVRLTRDSSLASNASTAQLVAPTSAEVARAEAEREVAGSQVRDLTLTAAPARIDLGDRVVSAWAFDAKVPGPTVRVNAGDVVRAKVVNDLPADLTAHWHGPAVRNDMDGVPDLTQKAIAPGDSFIYEFTAPDPGTYFYHPTHRHPAQPRSLRCARL